MTEIKQSRTLRAKTFQIGIALLVYGIFSVIVMRRQFANSVKAVGRVFAFGTQIADGGNVYCPQVEFQIPSGQTIKFQSKVGTQPPVYRVGQTVQVFYQADNPLQAEINSVTALWFVPALLIIMALGFSVMGSILFGVGMLVDFHK